MQRVLLLSLATQGLDFSVTTKIIPEIVIPELGLVQKSLVVNTTLVVTE